MSQSESLWDVNSRQNALLWGVEAVFRAFSPDEKPKNLASKGVQECVFNFYRPIV